MIDESMRPIPGHPGYFLSQDARVWYFGIRSPKGRVRPTFRRGDGKERVRIGGRDGQPTFLLSDIVKAVTSGGALEPPSYSRRPIADLEAHFWSKVDRRDDSSCWPWIGGRGWAGYGTFAVNRRNVTASRFSWELANGEIPEGLSVCHRCDNPPCVNPAHLFLGDAKDNAFDRDLKGRHARIAPIGEQSANAKLTDDQRLEIIDRYAAGESQKALAAEFGVARYAIQIIVWRHEDTGGLYYKGEWIFHHPPKVVPKRRPPRPRLNRFEPSPANVAAHSPWHPSVDPA